jgi:hypothetical protein
MSLVQDPSTATAANVKAASTAPVATDQALVVTISPNSPAFNANAEGYATTSPPTYANNTFQPLSLTTTGLLRIDGSNVVQPVSGTVTANQGTSPWIVAGNTAAGSGASTNLITIQGNASGTPVPVSGTLAVTQNTSPWVVSGTVTANAGTGNFNNASVSATAAAPPASATYAGVLVNTNAPSGLANGDMYPMSMTTGGLLRIDGVYPVNATTPTTDAAFVAGAVTTGAPSYTNGQMSALSLDTTGNLRVLASQASGSNPWVVSGTVTANAGTGTFTVGQATAANLNATVVGTVTANAGTGNFNNASVSANAATPPGSSTYMGASVTTNAPTYTTGQMDPLSLTTGGLLRIDGVYPVNATTPTTDITFVGGAVTTAAPAYTTGQLSALSLTTAGALRIDGSAVTQPVSGTVTANQGTANTLANAWSTKITDATNGPVAVKAASTASAAADPSLVVALSPNSPLPTGSSTIGAVNQGTANTLANAWSQKITDGTNGPVAVKAASTAAVAADPALVVAISPNNSISVGPVTVSQSDITGTGTLNAVNATASITNLAGAAGAGMTLEAGTLVGTITPQVTNDGGTSWVNSFFDDPSTGNKVASIVYGSANGTTVRTIFVPKGASGVRVIVTAFTSGTATCNLRASSEVEPVMLQTGAANATVQPPTLVQVGGWDSATTTLRTPAVKAASTAAAATDQALVVAVSPNNTVTVTQATAANLNATVTGTITANAGTGNFNNASVSATAAAPPASATYAGASVTTSAPTYTTGQMDPLSLTTGGLLRIDGVYPVNATTPTTDITFIGGAVTTAAPAYTTGQLSALSLDTAGNLRVNLTTALPAGANIIGALTANQSVNVAQIAGTNTVTAAAGVQKVGIVGNANATMDAALTAGTAPTNGLGTLGQYNTTLPAPTNAQTVSLQVDQSGNLLEFPGVQTKTGAVWTSATAINTLQFATGTTTVGAPLGGAAVVIQLDQTTTLTGGAVTFQGTYDGTNWVTIPTSQVLNPQTYQPLTNPYTFVPSTNQPFLVLLQGFQQIRLNLTSVITGTGSVSPFWTVLNGSAVNVNTQRSTIEPLYGTSGQAITITLASLANAAARQSTAVSNTASLYEDALLYIKITPAAAAVSATGYVNVYGYGSVDGGTNYPEGITGTDGALTFLTPTNLILLGQINIVANSTARSIGPVSFCRTYGIDRLPAQWGIVVLNETGAAFNATAGNFVVEYQGVNGQLV